MKRPVFPSLNCSTLILTLGASALFAADSHDGWSRFRGPNGEGVANANLPANWKAEDCAWKTTLPGSGCSSPVLWGGKVFLLCANNANAQRSIVCLSTTNGSILWTREYESRPFAKNRDNSYASSTPAVDDSRVYVYWATPEQVSVRALDHSGKEQWVRNLGPYKSQHGGGTSPILYKGLVIFNNDQEGQGESSLLGLDAMTGQTLWEIKRRTDRAAYGTPCLRDLPGEGQEVIFASSSHGLTGVDPIKGCVNWEYTNAFPQRVVSSPILAEGLLIGTCGEGGVGRRLVAFRPPSKDNAPELVYELKNNLPYVPTPLAVGALLFLWGDNGLVACHRPATGEKIWQHKISDAFYSSPVCANGRIYGLSKAGTLYVMAAGDKPELLASIPLGEPSFATPAVGADGLYLRTETHLLCVRGRVD